MKYLNKLIYFFDKYYLPIKQYIDDQYRFRFYLCILLTILSVTVEVISILLIPKIVDNISSLNLSNSAHFIVFFIIFIFINAFVKTAYIFITNNFSYKLATLYSRAIFETPLNSSLEIFNDVSLDKFVVAISTKCDFIAAQIAIPFFTLLSALLSSLAIIISVIYLFPLRGIIFLLLISLLYLFISLFLTKKIAQNGKVIPKMQSNLYNISLDSLSNTASINLLNLKNEYIKHFIETDTKYRMAISNNDALATAPKFFIEALGIILIIVIGFVPLLLNQTSIADSIALTSVLAFSCQKLLPILQGAYASIYKMLGQKESFKQVVEIANFKKYIIEDKIKSNKNSTNLLNDEISIEFILKQNLVFKEGEKVSFKDGFKLLSNKWYFLTGESGVGKSYLLRNLLKLQNINLSSVKVLNEQSLKELNLNIKDYWSLFGYADQDINLLNTPILYNVLGQYPGSLEKDKNYLDNLQRVDSVLDVVSLKNELKDNSSRDSYEYLFKPSNTLSGGQKQRILLAKALLKKPRFLIIDETLSGVSTIMRKKILSRIKRKFRKTSVIMILHGYKTESELFDFIIDVQSNKVEFKNI